MNAPRPAPGRAQGAYAPIPMNDLRRATAAIRNEIDRKVGDVIDSGWFVLGPEVTAFEAEFGLYCGVPHCVGVGNGTDALELALRGLGCAAGSEVVTVANAGMYSASAIVAVGARPVFADIAPASMTMCPRSLEQVIGPNTAAVVITHLYGRLADLDRLIAIAEEHGVPIIEDCAQAHGAERGGRKAGSFGSIGCFSFYPTKNLGALGDGGALTIKDDRIAQTVRQLRQYGWRKRYEASTLR